MIPKRSIGLIEMFKAHSEKLAADVESILMKSCKPDVERTCAGHDVTVERLKDLLTYINISNQADSMLHFQRFIAEGFDILRTELDWANIEQELFLIELKGVHTRRGGSVLTALMHLARTHFDNQNLQSPSNAVNSHDQRTIDISSMYLYSSAWVVDTKKLVEKILQRPNGFGKYKSSISHLLKAFTAAKNEPLIVHSMQNETVFDAIDHEDTYRILLSKVSKNEQCRLNKLRHAHNPELHGPEKKYAKNISNALHAGDKSKGAQWLYELSPGWFEECQSYVNGIYKKKDQKAAISAITRLTKLSSAIYDQRENLDGLDRLRSDGVSAFFDNDQVLIKQLLTYKQAQIRSCIGEVCSMHNDKYGSEWNLTNLNDLVITFDCYAGDDKYRSVLLDSLTAKYPTLAKSIYDYAQYELKRTDAFQRSVETVYGQVYALKAIFTHHLNLLDSNDHQVLAEHGIAALERDNCRIIKRIRSAINDKFKNSTLELGTARALQSTFRSFCSHYRLTDVFSYGVSGKKRKANEIKSKAADYYSKEEVAAIAYAIELGLLSENLSDRDELLLRLGRILLKTGWNLTPLLMLEIDDILQLDAPVTGKTAHFVRLFKKRAGYKTQFYEFEMNGDSAQKEGLVFGNEVTNALSDLEYIRDKMSSRLRPDLPPNSKLKYRLSLYRDNKGKILGFTHTKFSGWLTELLSRFECSVVFNVQRIRKGGLNYVYKAYAKKFKEYNKSGQHSLKTFLDVYLRDDGIRSEENIASATQIMSDYFAGRPLSEDIIIVTDVPANTKITPSGLCASRGNDAEFRAFEKQQQRLNRSSDTSTSQCGDFNACLFCRHFRLVADAEHVWRLLSYHRYVVGDMERGVSDYSNTTDQATFVEVLNKRVETMLTELREISADAVDNGMLLLKTRGCHDDWAFYANIGDTN